MENDIKIEDVVSQCLSILSGMVTGTVERVIGGTTFIIGDTDKILSMSHLTIDYDPIENIPKELRTVFNTPFRDYLYSHVKTMEGAIVVDENGYVVGTHRYLPIDFKYIEYPELVDYITRNQLGSRHISAITITFKTDAYAVVASEELAIRVFKNGLPIKQYLPRVILEDVPIEFKMLPDSKGDVSTSITTAFPDSTNIGVFGRKDDEYMYM